MTEEIEVNKLYGLPISTDNLVYLERNAHSFANHDHILIISTNKPCDSAIELTEEDYKLLQEDDWEWIANTSDIIREEQEAKYQEQIVKKQNDFFDRFEDELRKAQSNAEPK